MSKGQAVKDKDTEIKALREMVATDKHLLEDSEKALAKAEKELVKLRKDETNVEGAQFDDLPIDPTTVDHDGELRSPEEMPGYAKG